MFSNLLITRLALLFLSVGTSGWFNTSDSFAARIEWSCDSILRGEATLLNRYPRAGDLRLAPPHHRVFYASNESDWGRTVFRGPQTDVVAGIAGNAVWDLAVRFNARKMVLIDWSVDPLVGNEFLIAPLIELATSPAEFLSLISAVPIEDSMHTAPIEKVFRYIDGVISRSTTNATINSIRLDYVGLILKKLSHLPDEKKSFIRSYLSDWIEFGPDAAHGLPMFGPFDSQHSGTLAQYYSFYRDRYQPSRYSEYVFDPQDLDDPYLTPFQSAMAFARLKKLMREAEYLHANLFDPGLPDKLKEIGTRGGYESYAVNTSNVIDTWTDPQRIGVDRPQITLHLLNRFLGLATPEHPVQIFQTLGMSYEHHYLRFTYANEAQAADEIKSSSR